MLVAIISTHLLGTADVFHPFLLLDKSSCSIFWVLGHVLHPNTYLSLPCIFMQCIEGLFSLSPKSSRSPARFHGRVVAQRALPITKPCFKAVCNAVMVCACGLSPARTRISTSGLVPLCTRQHVERQLGIYPCKRNHVKLSPGLFLR